LYAIKIKFSIHGYIEIYIKNSGYRAHGLKPNHVYQTFDECAISVFDAAYLKKFYKLTLTGSNTFFVSLAQSIQLTLDIFAFYFFDVQDVNCGCFCAFLTFLVASKIKISEKYLKSVYVL